MQFPDLLKSLGLWSASYAALFSMLWGFFALMKGKDDPSRRRVIDWLENDTPAQTYRRLLGGLLDRIDTRLSAREIELGLPECAPGRAWSGGLLSLLLILAISYPFLSVFGQWVATGEARDGQKVVFARENRDLLRYFLGASFSASLAIWIGAQFKLTGLPRLISQLAAAIILYAVAFFGDRAIAFAFAGAGASAFALAFIPTGVFRVAAAFVFGFITALIVVGLGSGASVETFIFASGFAFAAAYTGAAAFAVAGIFTGASAGAGAFAVAFTVAGAFATGPIFVAIVPFAIGFLIASAIAIAVSMRAKTGKHPLRPLMSFSFISLGIVSAIILSTNRYSPGLNFSGSHQVLFFSVLPLLNALFDFASVGLTRYWLRKGLSGNMVFNGLRDAAAGMAIFIALGCTVIAFIHLVRPRDGTPLIDLDSLFKDLGEHPENYWWLFFMLFSTLLPTLIHAGIALFSVFTLMGPRLRLWLAQLFRMGGRGDAHPEWIARTVLSALAAAAIWLPVFLVIEALALFPGFVQTLTGLFRAFAEAIGAVPPGVQI